MDMSLSLASPVAPDLFMSLSSPPAPPESGQLMVAICLPGMTFEWKMRIFPQAVFYIRDYEAATRH